MADAQRFSRRDSIRFMGFTGAFALLGGWGARSDAQEQPKPANLQGAGFYRTNVGEVKITVVSDGSFPFNPVFPLFGANAGEDAVKQTLADNFIEADKVMGHVQTLVIESGSDTVLIDTGCGSLFGPTTGKLIPHLANAGIEPSKITAVLLTHVHPDHFGGLLDAEGKIAFPNAELLINKDEMAFWTGENPDLSKSGIPEDQRANFIAGAKRVLAAGKWTQIEGEAAIRSKITAIPAPGHTPGHQSVLIDGGGSKQLFYITDTVHHYAIVMPHPEYHVAFDTDRELAVQTRKQILDRAATDKLLVSGAHLPFPAVGHVKKESAGFAWHPAVWEW